MKPRPYIRAYFRCCHAYGRIYRSVANGRFEGRCPRCMVPVSLARLPATTKIKYPQPGAKAVAS